LTIRKEDLEGDFEIKLPKIQFKIPPYMKEFMDELMNIQFEPDSGKGPEAYKGMENEKIDMMLHVINVMGSSHARGRAFDFRPTWLGPDWEAAGYTW